MKPGEAVSFLHRLSFLLNAELPLIEGLRMVAQQGSEQSKPVFKEITMLVDSGKTLATSLSSFPDLWSPYVVYAIAAGEESGRLAESLSLVAEEMGKRAALKKKLLGALLYPFVIAIGSLLLVIVLTLYIFPKILPVLISIGGPLPLSTRIVLGISTYLRSWGILTITLLTIIGFYFSREMRRKPNYQRAYDRLMLKAPYIGPLLKDYYVASACRMTATLLFSGMTYPHALRSTGQSVGNSWYRQSLEEIREVIEKGGSVGTAFIKHGEIFSDTAIQLLSVGATSGQLAKAYSHVAEFHSRETDRRIQNLSTLIEPTVMITLGLVVGFVAISIIQPIYALSGHVYGA